MYWQKKVAPAPPLRNQKIKVLGYAPPARAQSGRAKRGEWPALKWLARKRSNVSSAAAVIRMGGKVRRRRRDGGARLRARTVTDP